MRQDKNPLTDRKKPPPPRETPAPAVKTESPPGSRLKRRDLRVLPSRHQQAKALRQPMQHQPTGRKKPPLLRNRLGTRAISRLDKPMERPTPTGPALQKGKKKAPVRQDKNPLTDRKKPPPPRETPAPAVKTESPPGSRLKRRDLRVLPSRHQQAKALRQPMQHQPTGRKKPPLLRNRLGTRAISRLDKPMERPTPTGPALQKGKKKAPVRQDKNPLTGRKKPPPPRETPAPVVRTEGPPGSRPRRRDLRVLPLRPHQAKALLIGSASYLEPMKTLRQPMQHQPTGRKKPPLLLNRPGTRATSQLDKLMKRPTPTGSSSGKKLERVPNLPENRPPMGRGKQRLLLRKPGTGPASPPGG